MAVSESTNLDAGALGKLEGQYILVGEELHVDLPLVNPPLDAKVKVYRVVNGECRGIRDLGSWQNGGLLKLLDRHTDYLSGLGVVHTPDKDDGSFDSLCQEVESEAWICADGLNSEAQEFLRSKGVQVEVFEHGY